MSNYPSVRSLRLNSITQTALGGGQIVTSVEITLALAVGQEAKPQRNLLFTTLGNVGLLELLDYLDMNMRKSLYTVKLSFDDFLLLLKTYGEKCGIVESVKYIFECTLNKWNSFTVKLKPNSLAPQQLIASQMHTRLRHLDNMGHFTYYQDNALRVGLLRGK